MQDLEIQCNSIRGARRGARGSGDPTPPTKNCTLKHAPHWGPSIHTLFFFVPTVDVYKRTNAGVGLNCVYLDYYGIPRLTTPVYLD